MKKLLARIRPEYVGIDPADRTVYEPGEIMARKTYSEEFRRQAVELYRSTPDATLRGIAIDLGTTSATPAATRFVSTRKGSTHGKVLVNCVNMVNRRAESRNK